MLQRSALRRRAVALGIWSGPWLHGCCALRMQRYIAHLQRKVSPRMYGR